MSGLGGRQHDHAVGLPASKSGRPTTAGQAFGRPPSDELRIHSPATSTRSGPSRGPVVTKPKAETVGGNLWDMHVVTPSIREVRTGIGVLKTNAFPIRAKVRARWICRERVDRIRAVKPRPICHPRRLATLQSRRFLGARWSHRHARCHETMLPMRRIEPRFPPSRDRGIHRTGSRGTFHRNSSTNPPSLP